MEKYKLPAWQIFCHLAAIYCLFIFDWYHYASAMAAYFVTGCLGITVTFHRQLTHKSYNTYPLFRKLGSIFGTLGGVGSSIGWVSIHRQHHRFSDTEKDPHSPKFGWLRSFYGSMFKTPKVQYVTDLLREPFQVFLHEHYWKINFIYALFLLAVGGAEWWLALHVFPSFILWTTMGLVNTLGHTRGYRNYADTREDSRNDWISGLLAWGEGWHNNHHADPGNWSLQVKWWEFDMSKWVIKLIKI